MTETALYFTENRAVEPRQIEREPPGAQQVAIETRVSAISAGTELLVYRNEVPPEIPLDATIDDLSGAFSFPLRYGYAAVGDVVETGSAVSDEWLERTVFTFAPHQTYVIAGVDDVVDLPDTLDSTTAALYPTLETATNFVLDGSPRLGERVVVFGAGVVGLCTTRLLSAFPLEELVVVDPLENRREVASAFGADLAIHPNALEDVANDVDLAFELSGRPAVLDDAIQTVGYGGRIVVGSWYGTKRAPIDLGSRFHRNRIELVSSQVSTIDPTHRGRWDHDRRERTALNWLERVDTDRLISHQFPLEKAPVAYELLDTSPNEALQVLLTYA